MGRLSDLNSQANRALHGGRAHTASGISMTGTAGAATFDTANTVTFELGGKFQSKTAITAGVFSVDATPYVQPISTTAYYIGTLDASGTVRTIPGRNARPIEGPIYGFLPDIADTQCPFAIIKVVTDSTHTFTPGTSNLNAAGLTVTYYDISVIPATAP